MDQPQKIVAFTCKNPNCQHKFEIIYPSVPGKYTVVCPNCNTQFNITTKPQPVKPQPVKPQPVVPVPVNPQPNPQPAPQPVPQPYPQPSPQPAPKPMPKPAPNNSLCEPKMIKADYQVGKPDDVKCAFGCGFVIEKYTPKLGKNILVCPFCKGKMFFEGRNRTIMPDGGKLNFQHFRGRLVLPRKFPLHNKSFLLNPGHNIIGRLDNNPQYNSDIAISNDPSMSRRSVDIEVKYDDLNGYTFQLHVLRSTNPVLVNRSAICQGESFSLNFGDSIMLGKTLFTFEKDV